MRAYFSNLSLVRDKYLVESVLFLEHGNCSACLFVFAFEVLRRINQIYASVYVNQ